MRIAILASLLVLAACGGDDSGANSNDAAAKEKHILSNEQELLQQAKGVGDLLNQNADKKKQAVEDATKN